VAPLQQSVKVTRPLEEGLVVVANPGNDAPCSSRPIRFGGTRTFQAIPGGTRITFSGGNRAGGCFGLADPLLLRAAQRLLRSDLAGRKRLFEGQPQG